MPNIITHTIFCEEVLKEIKNKKYKTIIENHMHEYRIGTNGPDFLFFYGFYPFWKKQDMQIANIGATFHNMHINDFYDIAIQQYHNQTNSDLKDAIGTYIIAHYLHWQLDSIMHPYVVYKTGFKEKMSKYYHHRFESMMDTIMLDRYRNETIKSYVAFKNCWLSQYSVKAISNVYCKCIKQCLQQDVSEETIAKSLQDWELAQRYLYDPSGIKYHLVKGYECIVNKPWLFSGNIVRAKIDHHHDVMNDNHKLWLHPCTGAQSKESVTDLFSRALENAKIGLPLLFNALDDSNKTNLFLCFIANKTYSNGISEKLPRIHKEVIYRK